MQQSPTLDDRLIATAKAWASASGSTLAKLGRLVVNDTAFFTRFENPGASTTTATLAKFARFLADPANWPEGDVPQEAIELAHVVGVSPVAASPADADSADGAGRSAGRDGEISPREQAA